MLVRHNFAHAGDGFVYPDLTVFPADGHVRMRWTEHWPPYTPLQFVSSGDVRIEVQPLEYALTELVNSVLDRVSTHPGSDSLRETWQAIQSLDCEELEFVRAAAMLGLDPLDVDEATAHSLVQFWQNVDEHLRADALAAADESSLTAVASWVDGGLTTLAQLGVGATRWDEVREQVHWEDEAAPWLQGYDLARSAREVLGLGLAAYSFDTDGPLAVHGVPSQAPSPRIDALVSAHAPACVVTRRSVPGKRFLLARALGDYLSRSFSRPALLHSLATDRQARTRAFAAEFLAPSRALREWAPHAVFDSETVDELAEQFAVSSQVIVHQVRNHQLGTLPRGGLPT